MNDFLKAFDGYFPWLVLLAVALLFRPAVLSVITAVQHRISAGAGVEITAQGASLKLVELVRNTDDAREQADGKIEVHGDPDELKLLFKAQGPGWKKSTKALAVPGGCLVQMSTEHQGPDGAWRAAEALQFVPGVTVLGSGPGGSYVLGEIESAT